ncbi:TRAP-type mannitol/chloroaromatic compound transport system, large permease component [Polynucleobacter duraquae]|uniref:TRAP-type mannitol/chloroaromatic compound transport system, large permease component n=1 Tax=Polynucleobacter duraquae TaxID=1835254 RepID=A0A0E3V166_9BURK|nr:TRAP transporter large permease subunit [Polynucleobacter duraquae]AKD25874.1 TRAP-type mannitol/chloroaromatic compound transport system, large permease component [Polynucleobacter duraquae]
MSDPILGLVMLSLIIVVIMLGFPTAFTLMGLGMMFGFAAFYDPAQSWTANKVFTLMVQRTFGGMTNDVLLSIPLFVLMGYVMERGALVDKMFYSIQLAFRRLPASLAVATLIVCTFWGIASGLVGAVVVLMGVIAMKPMLNAGYDTRLAAGVITAGGTLGILIPPSVMIIVYAAVAGQSVVKLYAAAMVPGFFLAFLYLVYIIGWALINPKVAPKLPPEQLVVPIPPTIRFLRDNYAHNMLVASFKALFSPAKLMNAPADTRLSFAKIFKNVLAALTPLALVAVTMWGVWWYVIIHQQNERDALNVPVVTELAQAATSVAEPVEEGLVSLDATSNNIKSKEPEVDAPLVALDAAAGDAPSADAAPEAAVGPPENFELYFGLTCILFGLLLIYYYIKLDEEQFEILKLLIESVMPLGVLTLLVLAVILLGITTATESAAVGALGAFVLAFQAGTLNFERTKQAVFLTAKTTSMVCWLFVGSALFSAVFTILGGQTLIEKWVLMLDLTPIQFMLLSQAIIFFLGWPLEWTEIIVIFVPIFLPLLAHFNIDPLLWGTLVFVNLQAAFLSPPVAMSAFYLKGVSPPGVTLNQIFAGMMPYMFIVIACMAFMYVWPGMTLWLPKFLYGG